MFYEDDDIEIVDDGERYETYEVVESSQSYLTPKKYVNLDNRILPVSAEYARTLEAEIARLRYENERLKEANARSGNRYLLADANDWMTRVRKLEMANANLRAKVRETEAEKNTAIREMEADHRMEMLETEHERDFYKAKCEAYIEMNSRSVNPNRNAKDGRFRSSDGKSGQEKRAKALEMFDKHVPYAEIARVLDVSVDTAKRYIREANHHRATEQVMEHYKDVMERRRYALG